MFGHRDCPEDILPALIQTVEQHIDRLGVNTFVVGNYGSFDRLAAKAVACCKILHSDITMLMLLPYHPTERPVVLPDEFDGSIYPPDMECVPRKIAIVKANQYAVDNSDYIIAFSRYKASNTSNLLHYARRLEKKGTLKVKTL